jgi:hypothetical protein
MGCGDGVLCEIGDLREIECKSLDSEFIKKIFDERCDSG